jgi:hypothetical protein
MEGVSRALQEDRTRPGSEGIFDQALTKDFVPDNPNGLVPVSIICTEGGTADESPKTATEDSRAAFTITGFAAGGTGHLPRLLAGRFG